MSPATVNGRPDTGCIAPAARLPLTSLCPFRRSRDDIPDELRGYYAQRHTIFSRYDSGIRLTDAAWYGVTPEAVAQEIAQDMKNSDPCKRFLIDAFAGAGGNVIAFALSGRWHHVIAIERDPHTLACAQHNANIYGVDDSMVSWVLGDSFDFIDALVNHPAKLHPDLRVDVNATVVFSSPPWGGPSYQNDRVFDLHRMEPYGLDKLHEAYITMDHAIYLPRTSDVRQIADLVPNNQRIRVVHYCIRKASKAMVAYLPAQKAQQTRTVPPPTSSAVDIIEVVPRAGVYLTRRPLLYLGAKVTCQFAEQEGRCTLEASVISNSALYTHLDSETKGSLQLVNQILGHTRFQLAGSPLFDLESRTDDGKKGGDSGGNGDVNWSWHGLIEPGDT
ncbi:hypothetical protein CDD82_4477 [Ophiocordyceps australis]|uniref:Trimethylguanosine synthase n=1 Tax=Ophiocordyceps australis TaxID=1399860 RepID=A0A2C5Z5T7_9HYPO|nr:hypothetical protein CDD82_4477 [Ophiocordyceps australis]